MAKIQLSEVEKNLVADPGWILVKHNIIKKIFSMFGVLSEGMKTEIDQFRSFLPAEVINKDAKISRGENYQLLPYVMLDYPSFFSKENIFVIRTMFWWGNFFSITLHINGIYKQAMSIQNGRLCSALQKSNFYICINEAEWEHHFQPSNYIAVSTLNEKEFNKIFEQKFFKIATKIPITEWDNAEFFLIKSFREILQFLQISFQDGEKDLSPGFPITDSGP